MTPGRSTKGPHLIEPARLAGEPAKACPRCGCNRVHRSHRRAALDRILYALGAEIRRCSQCRSRHAAFTSFTVPLDGQNAVAATRLTGILVVGSGFLACLLIAWWAIRRFTELAG